MKLVAFDLCLAVCLSRESCISATPGCGFPVCGRFLFVPDNALVHAVGYFYFFQWLAGPVFQMSTVPSFEGLLDVSRTLGCWMPNSNTAADNANCTQLMYATLLALLVLPVVFLISGGCQWWVFVLGLNAVGVLS